MLPYQKLTDAEKVSEFDSIEKWGEQTINSIVGLSNSGTLTGAMNYMEIQNNINMYNSIIDINDLMYITNPYGITSEFPATLRNYNIVKPKIDLLLGEQIKRPFNFRVIDANPDNVTQMEKQREEMIKTSIKNMFLQEAYKAGNENVDPEVMNKQVQTPEEIDNSIKTNYSGMREHIGNSALNYLIWSTDFKRKEIKGLKEYLITGSEIYYTGLIGGEPAILNVDPRFFYCQLAPENDFVEDAQYCFYIRHLTPSQIYDELFEYLTEEDIQKIEDMKQGNGQTYLADSGLGVPIIYQNIDKAAPYNNLRDRLVSVIHVCWQSLRKVGFLSFIDDLTGEPMEEMVDETFVLTEHLKDKGYQIEWKWINEVWEGTKIADNIFVNIRPLPNQNKSLDNPSKCKLPYTGTYNNQSLISIMKPHQYLYDILMYRMEMSLARSKDKAMVMDVAQIPKSMGIDTQKWLYYLDTLGIAFINSMEEGTGNQQGKTPSFNNFQSIDMSMARILDQYIMMLSKVEDMIGEISGVSRQRQGEISSNELVGNVERSVVQSSNITEWLFNTHNEVKRRVLTNILEVSKAAWVEGKKAQYVTDDLTRMFFSVEPTEYAESNYGLFITNSTRDQQNIDTLKQLAQSALQAGQISLKDIASILQTTSITDIVEKLEKGEEHQFQKQQQLEQQKAEATNNQLQLQLQDKQADRDLKDQMNIRDNETKLQIAFSSETEQPEDNTQEVHNKFLIDKEKNQIQREKHALDHKIDNEQIKINKKKAEEDAKAKLISARKKPSAKK